MVVGSSRAVRGGSDEERIPSMLSMQMGRLRRGARDVRACQLPIIGETPGLRRELKMYF